jgi:uncharacterized protein DUF6491
LIYYDGNIDSGWGLEEDAMIKSVLLVVAFAVSGCVSSASNAEMSEKAAATLAKYERTGETTRCLSTRSINSITALDDYHFLVRTSISKYYLNVSPGRCSGAARFGTRIQYALSGGQLCQNQIIEIVDNSTGMTTGGCGLGLFERLEKLPAETE